MADNTEEYGVVLTAKDKTRKAVQAAAAGITKIVKKYDTMARKSESVSKGVGKDLGRMVKGYLALGIGVAAAYKTIQTAYRFVDEAITLAGEQQEAETRLAAAIRARGLETEELLPRLIEEAQALQMATGAADEQVIAMQSMALGMDAPIEKLDDMMLALENSTAAGLPQETMLRGLTASLQGSAGMLGRYIPSLRNLTEEELKAGGAIDAVNEAFAGQAEALKFTLPGSIRFAKGAWDDYNESVGTAIAQSKHLRAAFIAVGEMFLKSAGNIAEGNEAWAESTEKATSVVIEILFTAAKAAVFAGQAYLTFQNVVTGALGLVTKAERELTENRLKNLKQLRGSYLAAAKDYLDKGYDISAKRSLDSAKALNDQIAELESELTGLNYQVGENAQAGEDMDRKFKSLTDTMDGLDVTQDDLNERIVELIGEMGDLSVKSTKLGDDTDDLTDATKKATFAAGDFSKAWDQGVSRALLHTANAGEILQQVLDDTADTTFRGTVAAYDELIARSDILTMKSGELWGVIEGFPVETLAQFRGEFALWMDEALNGTEATEEGLRNLIVRMGAFTEAQEAMSESALAAWRGYSEGIENFGVKATNIALGTIEQLYDSAFSAIGTIITDNIAQVTGMGDEWRKVVGVVIDALVKIAAAAIASGAAQGLAGAAAAAGKGAATAQTWQTAIVAAIAVAGSVIATVLATIGTAETYESGIKGASGGLFAGGTPNVDSINATVMPGELLMPTDVAAAYLEEKRASRDRRQGGGDGMTVNYAPQYGGPFVPDSRIGFQRKAQEHLLEFDREMEILGRRRG